MKRMNSIVGAVVAIMAAAPAAAHIPERCYPLVAERTAANEAAADGFETVANMVFDRMPMFMIEQAVLEASDCSKTMLSRSSASWSVWSTPNS